MTMTNHHETHGSQPLLYQRGQQIQQFGTLRLLPIALSHDARLESCQLLNKILADSQILYSLYKKHHWLMRGHTFYQLHLLLNKHADEQLAGYTASRVHYGRQRISCFRKALA